GVTSGHLPLVFSGKAGGLLDGRADARVGGAAADVAAHRVVDVLVGGLRRAIQQRRGGHDLPGLAVATLHDVEGEPGFLHFLARVALTDAFDGGDLRLTDRGNRRDARTRGVAVDVDRAGAAQAHATAELTALQFQLVAEYPEQRCVGFDLHRARLA